MDRHLMIKQRLWMTTNREKFELNIAKQILLLTILWAIKA